MAVVMGSWLLLSDTWTLVLFVDTLDLPMMTQSAPFWFLGSSRSRLLMDKGSFWELFLQKESNQSWQVLEVFLETINFKGQDRSA